MVANYLSLLLTLILLSNNIQRNVDNRINHTLEIGVVLNKDTLSFDEELTITIIFKNKTNNCQFFYPKAILFLVRQPQGFEYQSLYLNKYIDLTILEEIQPKGCFTDKYKIKINKSFFKEEENSMKLFYVCSKFKRVNKNYNKLYGSLETTEFKIFVINET